MMGSDAKIAFEEVSRREVSDPLLLAALHEAWDVVTGSRACARLDSLDLYVIDSGTASPAVRASRYYTTNWLALLDEGAVVVDERFLARVETALRTLATSGSVLDTPCLRSNGDIFGFVRSVSTASAAHIGRLRRLTAGYGAPTREGQREEDIRRELALVAAFFLAHEVGHLLDGRNARSFGSSLPPGTPLEQRVAHACVKLARHVDEFERHGFGLPGFERVAESADPVRRLVEDEARRIGVDPHALDQYFTEETVADRWATQILEEHLSAIGQQDERAGDLAKFLLSRGVFGVALFSWSADLLTFLEALGTEGLTDSRVFTLAMAADHENYVRAASLFGSVHRSTLLRGALAIEAALKVNADWFDPEARADASGDSVRQWWVEESVIRYFLLAHMIDTAVKLAYVGCSSVWWEQNARERGTYQVFVMTFESIDGAIRRLRSYA